MTPAIGILPRGECSDHGLQSGYGLFASGDLLLLLDDGTGLLLQCLLVYDEGSLMTEEERPVLRDHTLLVLYGLFKVLQTLGHLGRNLLRAGSARRDAARSENQKPAKQIQAGSFLQATFPRSWLRIREGSVRIKNINLCKQVSVMRIAICLKILPTVPKGRAPFNEALD